LIVRKKSKERVFLPLFVSFGCPLFPLASNHLLQLIQMSVLIFPSWEQVQYKRFKIFQPRFVKIKD